MKVMILCGGSGTRLWPLSRKAFPKQFLKLKGDFSFLQNTVKRFSGNIDDENIFLAANPDSLYLKRAEWEANLFDYGKTLNSFNFIKCAHGKDVADDVLLNEFVNARLKNSNVFILTFDRELKERFTDITDQSNNLFIMGK